MKTAVLWGAASVGVVCFGHAAPALAHPSSAEPPVFRDEPCITVVDKQVKSSFAIGYDIPTEDTAPEPDLVELPDTKSHQFMALAAHAYVRATLYEMRRFGAPPESAVEIPLWLSQSDVTRTKEAAVDNPNALAAIPDGVPVLEDDPDLKALFYTINEERVPITSIQGLRGVTWDLAMVPTGVYQILGFIFSPPYNDWAVRPGYVKVVDGEAGVDAPVLWLDNPAARLFAGQGKRVTGCVDAPAGSTLTISVRPAGDPSAPFELVLRDVAIEEGRFDGCLLNRGQNASLIMQVTLTTPDGTALSTYSEETIDMFQNVAGCTANERMCCDPSIASASPAAMGAAGAAGAPSGVQSDGTGTAGLSALTKGSATQTGAAGAQSEREAGAAAGSMEMAIATAESATADGGGAESAGPRDESSRAESAGGCSVQGVPSGRSSSSTSWLALLVGACGALAMTAARRARRR